VAAGVGYVLIGVDGNMNYIGKMTSLQLDSRGHGFVFVINFQANEKPPISSLAFCFEDGSAMFLPDDPAVTVNFVRQCLFL
jgi:hypothetical protein